MYRNRNERRRWRERAISRKEHILRMIGGEENVQAWTLGKRGRLSKGKIHCSCWMCRPKTFDQLPHRDAKRFEFCNSQRDAA